MVRRAANRRPQHRAPRPPAGRRSRTMAVTGRKNRPRAPVERRCGRQRAREREPTQRDLSPTAPAMAGRVHGGRTARQPTSMPRTYPTAAGGVRHRGRPVSPAARRSRRVHPADPAAPASPARCRPAGTRRRCGRCRPNRRDGRTIAPPRAGAPSRAPRVGPPAGRLDARLWSGRSCAPPCQRRPSDAIPEVRRMRLVRV